jgi:NADPH-dependent glutamate synthase beta subunit-like oxidoreductase/ferredoxin
LASSKKEESREAANSLNPPGLIEILVRRTFRANSFSGIFHLGMATVLLTGIMLAIVYFSGMAGVFGGWGWILTWIHGLLGLTTAVGFAGILARYRSDKLFKPTAGKMFKIDAVLIGIILITGIILALRMLDLLPVLWGWETTIHLVAVIVWLLVSLLRGGLVAHAVSSIVYSYTAPRSQAAFEAFGTVGDLNLIQLAAHVSGSTIRRPTPLPKAERELWMDYSKYWIGNIKCRSACPVHTDVSGYVSAIAEGRDEDAYQIARANNPFASICGMICGAPCEANCRRGDLDAPVAIRALKRYVTEKYGPGNGDDAFYHKACDERMLPPDHGDYEKVAVVGAGVAGLTVAHDLRRLGYQVTVFEADSVPGGMLAVGVPVYRLPREQVQHEIQAILSLGIELKYNMRLGRDFNIEDLRKQGFKAIFLGVGLPRSRKLPLPGTDLPNVHDGLEFLRGFNEGAPLPLGRRVVVIGGGFVAYDVARSALRLEGDREVHIVCLEQRPEMPADEREITEGEEEGIRLHDGWGPRDIVQQDSGGITLRMVKCASVFDEKGRFSPDLDESVTESIDTDNILFAIGQTSDLSFLGPEDKVELERDLIKVNVKTCQTTAPDIFACGDVAHGARLFIDAIASAHVAARSMHDYLRGLHTDVVVRKQWTPASFKMAEGWERVERREAPIIEAEQRIASGEPIERVYPEEEARRESSRCLRCEVNTIFDSSVCVACKGCVEACPQNIIKPVGLSRMATDESWQQQASLTFSVPLEDLKAMSSEQLDSLGAVMVKDETTCIRCAACASRCPTLAVSMQTFTFHRECVSSPTRNPNLQYS